MASEHFETDNRTVLGNPAGSDLEAAAAAAASGHHLATRLGELARIAIEDEMENEKKKMKRSKSMDKLETPEVPEESDVKIWDFDTHVFECIDNNNSPLELDENPRVNNITNDFNPDDKYINSVFGSYEPGPNVLGDGNCGLYAICEGMRRNDKTSHITISHILELLKIKHLPSYWWADDELASIVNTFGFNTFIFDDANKTGVVYYDNIFDTSRPPIVLYNTNNNSHWIPGVVSTNGRSDKIPKSYITISEVIPIEQIIQKKNDIDKRARQSSTVADEYDNEVIRDNKGTVISISRCLKPSEQLQVKNMFRVYIDLFPTDSYNVKPANVEPCAIKMKPNCTDSKFGVICKRDIPEQSDAPSEHLQVKNMFSDYMDLISTESYNVKPANVEPCAIKMKPNCTDSKFGVICKRDIPEQSDDAHKEQFDKLLVANIIRPSNAKMYFAPPSCFIQNNSKTSDILEVLYDDLNKRVVKEPFNSPKPLKLVRELAGSRYFSRLVFNKPNLQIPVKLEDQHYFEFSSFRGLMTFTRLPRKFKNTNAIVNRILKESFSGLLYKSLIITHVNDIISYGKDFEQALIALGKAFEIIDSHNFTLKTSKCSFFYGNLEYAGFHLTPDSIKPTEKRLKLIREFCTPSTRNDIISFINKCSYYKNHVDCFEIIARPLKELIKSDTKEIEWNEEHTKCVKELIHRLNYNSLLKHINKNKRFYLTTNVLKTCGFEAYLNQFDDNHDRQMIGCASRNFSKTKRLIRDPQILELLGLVFGVTYFRKYLPKRFVILCDYNHIKLYFKSRLRNLSVKKCRLALKLLNYKFEFKKPKDNKRGPYIVSINRMNDIDDDISINLHDIQNQQSRDTFCSNVIRAINDRNNNQTPIKIKRKAKQFIIIDNILYYKRFTPPRSFTPILTVPKSLTSEILNSYCDAPKKCIDDIMRIIHRIRKKYFWPTISKDTILFIKSNLEC